MSEVNVPLLRKMVEWVEEQEKLTEGREWYQPTIIAHSVMLGLSRDNYCGTVYCVAGKVAVDNGWTNSMGDPTAAIDYAESCLGLKHIPDHGLFVRDNTAEDIRRIAEDIAGEKL